MWWEDDKGRYEVHSLRRVLGLRGFVWLRHAFNGGVTLSGTSIEDAGIAGVEKRDFGSPDESRKPDKTRVERRAFWAARRPLAARWSLGGGGLSE